MIKTTCYECLNFDSRKNFSSWDGQTWKKNSANYRETKRTTCFTEKNNNENKYTH